MLGLKGTPSPQGGSRLITTKFQVYFMATLEIEAKPEINDTIALDLECPRCYEIMTPYSEFDNLFYACEACDFILHTVANNKA